jgi:hypothetical protein
MKLPAAIALSLALGAGPALAEPAGETTTTAAIDLQGARNAVAEPARNAVDQVFGQGQGAQPGTAAPAAAAPADAGTRPLDRLPFDGSTAAAPPAEAEPGQEVVAAVPDLGRDPFRPFTLDLRPDVPEGEILTPLQRYELPQLRLAGVVLDLQIPRAMLQDNSGMGFIVTPGTPIGRRRGVVKAIEPRRVVVEETILDYYGREQVHQVAIEMAKDDKPQSANQE